MDIYFIKNSANDKVYIGQTTKSYHERCRDHWRHLAANRHYNEHLQRAFNHYGVSAFQSGSISTNVSTQEELDALEQLYIAAHNTTDRSMGYNMLCGGSTTRHTDETKQKISVSNTGKKRSAATKLRLSDATKRQLEHKGHPLAGSKMSEQTKARIGDGNRGKVQTTTHKLKKSRDYPSFVHEVTGEIIPAGRNLNELCKTMGLHRKNLRNVINRTTNRHKGWMLLEEE